MGRKHQNTMIFQLDLLKAISQIAFLTQIDDQHQHKDMEEGKKDGMESMRGRNKLIGM